MMILFKCVFKIFLFKMKVHCQWEQFGNWSTCSESCGGGIQSKVRAIKTLAQHNGMECTGNATQQRSCNNQPCPGIVTKTHLVMDLFVAMKTFCLFIKI